MASTYRLSSAARCSSVNVGRCHDRLVGATEDVGITGRLKFWSGAVECFTLEGGLDIEPARGGRGFELGRGLREEWLCVPLDATEATVRDGFGAGSDGVEAPRDGF